ncbi:DUF1759 domain-containing protein, partial [Klebsiella pneumoniae]|uniref:DUF1759 domain-containing protein n=1 Tax=Klebsiella pneumoniae TaxID=573 RepID=UPI003EBB538A
LFQCSVHGRDDLTDIQKFTYLKGQLEGEAKQLIAGFSLESHSYQPAVSLLTETYGRADRIKAAHVTTFCSLEPPRFNIQNLKEFHASLECSLKSMKAMNITLEEFFSVMILL